jgi:hypothetical protein
MSSGIVVNVSKKEAEAKSFDILPKGIYRVTITSVDLEEVKNPPAPGKKDNRGKPMYNFQFTVVESGNEAHDKYAGQSAFTRACLWEGALYTIINISKAIKMEGVPDSEGTPWEIPAADEYLGEELLIKVVVQPERTVDTFEGKKTYDEGNDVKGFFPIGSKEVKVYAPRTSATAGAGAASSGGMSILP